MSASALLSLGVKAMTANYAALQTTGNNIANANVVGYSRQQVVLATTQGQSTGAGYFGRGVDVATVTRSHDEFLTREAAAAKALSAMDSARLAKLQQLEAVFKPGEGGLGDATSQLFNAMVDLSSQPNDLSARQVVLARAGDLATRFSESGAALDTVQASVDVDVKASVSEINSLARSIASANQRIAEQRGQGQPANDLLDERDRLIGKLSEQVQVTRIDAADGSVGVFIGGGQRLVLGSDAAELKAMPDAADPTRSAVAIMDGTSARLLDDTVLGGGKLAGLLRFQNIDMVQGRAQIGRLAAAVAGAINDQQTRGLSLQLPLGQVSGSPLFAMGPSQALPNAANARDASGNAIGSVTLTITDSAALQASEYDLRESSTSPGSWALTRLSDGTVSTVNSGDVVDGLRIDINNAQSGDRFLLQPVSRVANGMSKLLSDPRDLAAASPLLATTAAGNTGTATVASLQVTASPLPTPGASTRLTFTDDAGAYAWDLLDAGNNVLASGNGNWQAGQALPPTGQDINGFSLLISGVPRSGDIVTVAPTPASSVASNNGNALSLLALRDAALAGGHTATDAWAQAIADVGVRTQSAQASSEISTAVADQAELLRSSQAGVNLDEEAARLIQYQQSYQAAAKMLQVAQTLFDTLLQAAAR
jgi:flagellar hook-associated protein 1 FlgK